MTPSEKLEIVAQAQADLWCRIDAALKAFTSENMGDYPDDYENQCMLGDIRAFVWARSGMPATRQEPEPKAERRWTKAQVERAWDVATEPNEGDYYLAGTCSLDELVNALETE